MATQVGVSITATVVHRAASSACCGDKLQLPEPGAEHEYECASCGQPTERILGDPRHIAASGTGIVAAPGGEF